MSRRAARASRGASPSLAPRATASSRRRTCGSTRCRTISRRRAFRMPSREQRWPAQLHVIGKDITRFHSRDLARNAEGRGARAPRAHLGARLRASRRRAIQQERRREARSGRGDRPLRPGCVPIFPAARSSVRRATATSRGSGSRSATTPISRTRFGNLASRTIAMVEKYRAGVVPAWRSNEASADRRRGHGALHAKRSNDFLLHDALKAVLHNVAGANEYVDRQAPWKLAKDPAGGSGSSTRRSRRSRESSRSRPSSLRPSCPARHNPCGSSWADREPSSVQRLASSGLSRSHRLEGDERGPTLPSGAPGRALAQRRVTQCALDTWNDRRDSDIWSCNVVVQA